jgi:hypothetical protein
MLMIVDIDDFKHVNDTMGHLIGDRVLVEAAQRLKRRSARTASWRGWAATSSSSIARRRRAGPIRRRPAARSSRRSSRRSTSWARVFSTNVSIGIVTSTDADDDLDA